MDDDIDLLLLLELWNLLGLLYVQYAALKRRRVRRCWVRPVNRNREERGHYDNLFKELLITVLEQFFKLTRMSPNQFKIWLRHVSPFLAKTSFRTPLPTELRLAVTLSFLAHGDELQSVAWNFRIGKSTVYKVVYETCQALWSALQPMYLPPPTQQMWQQVANGFCDKWNFPNCVGAVDGKHIAIQAPLKGGSLFYNFKNFQSIVMMATCDSDYRFTWINVGDYGHISDGGIWNTCDMGRVLENRHADLPHALPLPGTDPSITVPFVFVRDEAFPLKTYMMHPYPRQHLDDEHRVYNYRLSRARRVIENTFGILVSRWRILMVTLCCNPENTESVVKATVCHHNFLMSSEGREITYCPTTFVDAEDAVGNVLHGELRQVVPLDEVGRVGSNNPSRAANLQRQVLKDYVNSDAGEIPWQ